MPHTHAHTHTHTHTLVSQGNRTEEKVFEKRKVFKEDLKELTEVEWWTETGSWKKKLLVFTFLQPLRVFLVDEELQHFVHFG